MMFAAMQGDLQEMEAELARTKDAKRKAAERLAQQRQVNKEGGKQAAARGGDKRGSQAQRGAEEVQS